MIPTLALAGVRKKYLAQATSVDALSGISLDIAPGTVYGLVGRNGAGKSTLLRICAGLILPDQGTVRFQGASLAASRGAMRRISCLFDSARGLHARLSPLENLEYFGTLKGLRSRVAREEGAQLLNRLRLSEKSHSPTQTLSRGMQQRLALACALVNRPQLLLLDEPTLGMDAETTVEFLDILRQEAVNGTAILLSSHDANVIAGTARRIGQLAGGRIVDVAVDTPGRGYVVEFEMPLDSAMVAELTASVKDISIGLRSVSTPLNQNDLYTVISVGRHLGLRAVREA